MSSSDAALSQAHRAERQSGSGPQFIRPVVVGPITVGGVGGVPFIAITEPISMFSGRRLASMVMAALTEAGFTIDIPD